MTLPVTAKAKEECYGRRLDIIVQTENDVLPCIHLFFNRKRPHQHPRDTHPSLTPPLRSPSVLLEEETRPHHPLTRFLTSLMSVFSSNVTLLSTPRPLRHVPLPSQEARNMHSTMVLLCLNVNSVQLFLPS
jgi:hypothetical protein